MAHMYKTAFCCVILTQLLVWRSPNFEGLKDFRALRLKSGKNDRVGIYSVNPAMACADFPGELRVSASDMTRATADRNEIHSSFQVSSCAGGDGAGVKRGETPKSKISPATAN